MQTDVIQAPAPYQQANTERIRPARPGTSIGEISTIAGTFGAVVIDAQTGESMILSNNHVLANNNQAPLGSPIVQPGPFDGGKPPDDIIAALLRFVPLSPDHDNLVDAAIARPGSPSLIENHPLNGVPAPSSENPAFGLLWGGDSVSYSIASPIHSVLALLDVRLPAPDAVGTPAVNQSVQKTGRTTERTTGVITHIHVTQQVSAPPLGMVTLVDQFRTTKMSEGGDSGSLIVGA